MCDPLSITMGVVSLAGVGLDAAGKAKAKKENKKEAKRAFQQNIADLNARAAEEEIAALSQRNALARQAQNAAALARVSAAAGGVEGATVDAQQHVIAGDLGRADAAITENLDATLRQIERARRGQIDLKESREHSVAGPNPLGVGVQLAGVGLDIWSRLLINKPKIG